MVKYKFLSHKIEKYMPSYGKIDRVWTRRTKSIQKGDSCNTFEIRIPNHIGTHVDAPAHFFESALKISDFSARECIFNDPYILNCSLKNNELLDIRHLKNIPKKKIDILLFKTNFQKFRGQDVYFLNNPGISYEVPLWLKKNFPSIKAIGIDFVSISCFKRRKTLQGVYAHRAFLNPKSSRSILIIEDMDLSGKLQNLKQVIISPFRFTEIDSSFCTIIGIFK
ncbi:MAG: cyclase family protein [Patescibacteria group bacterium]